MMTFSLQSGSNGNAIYVEAGGARLLFDAGISGKQAFERLQVHGRLMSDVTAVIISHDHADHIRAAGVWQRRFGFPIYATERTFAAASSRLGKVRDVRHFTSGDSLSFGPVTVHTFPTEHDAVDGSAFVVEAEGKRLGVMTDLGQPSDKLLEVLRSLDAAYLEFNYDPHMLATGDYPKYLQDRITGPGGHLSNNEAADLVRACGHDRPEWLAVSHLSEDNNTPELAIEALKTAIGRNYPVHHASRFEPSPVLHV